MATSLLFQHLQQTGLPALQELLEFLCARQPTCDVTQCQSSIDCGISRPRCSSCTSNHVCCRGGLTIDNNAAGPLSNCESNQNCNHAECLARRILLLSTRLVPPSPPYGVDTNGVLHTACPSPRRTSCSFSSDAAASDDGPPSGRNIFSIDSVALASAAFVPFMFPLFRKLWEASDKSALQLPSDGSRGVVPLEVWKLRPSAELSGQLKLWGNAALARGRPAAAASLYTAGILLLPNSESSTSPSSSSSLLAVLSANASLVLLRLGKAKRALRTATEAVAADPRYRKAWHRRAAALVHLRCELERYFLASRSTSSTCNSESSIDRSTSSCSRAARACLEQLDREIADAQMISQGQANDSDAAAAASRMMVGCCGCDCNAALRPPSESKGCSASHSPGLWLRKDVSVQLDAKGWGLVTANDALSTMESDPCLVLEEEAFAVYVHPKLCAAVPKIPFSLPASFTVATAQDPVGLKLHPDVALRDEWEARVEEGAEDKKESEENHDRDEERHGVSLLKEEMDGVCAGCATLPVRQDGSANECYRQGLHSWQSVLSSILFPTVPVVPCGSCAAALFCCRSCRAASSHKRICGSQQQQYLQQEGCGLEPSAGHGDNRKEEEEAAANTLETPVQPLALALPDPHRHIARQLLASVLAPSAALGKQADGANSAALAKAPIQAAGELSTTPDCAGLSILGEPPWCQLQMRTSSTVVDSTRVADWLLNAAWLAGEAAAFGRGLHCGGRCLICRPNGKKAALLSRPASAAATTSPLAAATDPPLSLDGTVTEQLGGCCCVCCRAWCPECSVRSSTLQGSDGSTHCLVPFPRCLFSAALHVYGVACCNSFTIRVLCDPEDEGVAAGTAVFLAASLINHSCAPNAIAAFGEPGGRLQWRQQRREKALGLHKDADSPPAQRFDLLPSPRGVGRGVLLQIRLCAPQNSEGGRLQEICISYGSMIGLPKSSWGFRQDWMLKHAGFFCRCEACLPPGGGTNAAVADCIAYQYELLYGLPCPLCTSISRARELLESMQQNSSSEQGHHALFDTVANLRRCLRPDPNETSLPLPTRLTGQATTSSLFSKMPAKTLDFVTSFSRLLFQVLAKGQMQRRHTSKQILALVGHSCTPLWSPQGKAFPDSSAIMSSFLNKNTLIYEFREFYCINCDSRFPAAVLEKNREAIHVQLNRLRSALRSYVNPLSKVTKAEQCELLNEVLKGILQAIPHLVAVSGSLSTDVWQALQSAARAAHEQAEVMRQVHGGISSVESAGIAASCMSAAVYILLQRLPLGLSQPEVCAHMYRAALLLGQVGDLARTKQILRACVKATLNSCGPHSVIQRSLKEYLLWLERSDR